MNRAFLGKGNEILIVREGERLEGSILVRRIEPSQVILRETTLDQDATLGVTPSGS